MAVLTDRQLAKMRQRVSSGRTCRWSKSQINAALQAIEDWFEDNKASGSAAINIATDPFTFTGPVKKALFAYWLLTKHEIERV